MTAPREEPGPAADAVLPLTEHRITTPRSARYYTAAGAGPVREVWVVLHGFSMLARTFVRWFRPAVAPGRLLVAPEALNRYYTKPRETKVGATWMTSEDREAEIRDYVAYLDRVLADVREIHAAHGAPVQVHGFSQGTATAARWVAFGEARPARLVLWAGGVPPDLDLTVYGARLHAARLTLVLGDRDEFISEEVVTRELERLQGAGLRPDVRRFSGGHVIPWPVLEALAAEG
jgi:predicted esterase